LKSGRTTTALLIAERGGPELYEDIKQRYFELEKDSFITSVVQAINGRDLSSLTNSENLKQQKMAASGLSATNWKQNIAYLMSYFEGSVQERNEIINEMGETLLEQRDISAAIVCFILSMNVKEVLNIWHMRAIHEIKRKECTREVALANLLQKFILMRLALQSANNQNNGIEQNDDFNQVLAEVGNYLTSDEQAAVMYIKYLNLSQNSTLEVAALRDRLYHAHEDAMYGKCQLPQLPF